MDRLVRLKDDKAGIGILPATVSDGVLLTNTTPLAAGVGLLPAGTDCNGMTLTRFFNHAFGSGDSGKLAFLHLSDTHRYPFGMRKAVEMMGDDDGIRFTVITGDLQLTDEMKEILRKSPGPIYLLPGNHDVNDDFSCDSTLARNEYIFPFCGAAVNMGSDRSSYWHQDVVTDGASLRLIAFDEYEYSVVGNPVESHCVVYSQTQMEWFMDLLRNTPSYYNLILLHHQPVATHRDVGNTGLFTSENAPRYYEYQGGDSDKEGVRDGVCDAGLIPKIMAAYLSGGTFAGTFFCGDAARTRMTLSCDFSGIRPCRFIAHIGGHTHWDVCEYLPAFPEQLQLLIDQDRTQKYHYSDMARSETDVSAYCINRYTLDFDKREIVIERIGAHLTDGGADRSRIVYPLEREE